MVAVMCVAALVSQVITGVQYLSGDEWQFSAWLTLVLLGDAIGLQVSK